MAAYYMCLLLFLLFFTEDNKNRLVILLTVFVVNSEFLVYDLFYRTAEDFYIAAVGSEVMACLLIALTYRFHRSKFIVLPFVVSLLFNSFCHELMVYGCEVSDDVYGTVNLLLYETIIAICIYSTRLPEMVSYLYEAFINKIDNYISHFKIPYF